ncbi:MAG: alpha/beta hydrolase [Hyphomicrobiaceae bacterium]
MFRRRQSVRASGGAASGDRVVVLRDGRTLGYREYGDAGGFPVIALHGTPGSRLKYGGAHAGAVAKGLRILALDRWGYGLSCAKPAATLAGYGADAEELADRLGLGRFAVTGVSGGGPFAVAVAAKLKDRVAALALVSPVGVINGPSGRAVLSPFHAMCFQLAPRIPGLLGCSFLAYRAMLAAAPDVAMRIAVVKSAPADRALMRDKQMRAGMAAMFAEGLAAGVLGPVTDMALFGREWFSEPLASGFEGSGFSGVSADVRIWIGLKDRNVPLAAVRALHASLPGSDCIEIADAGHQWLAGHFHVVFDWIHERARQ